MSIDTNLEKSWAIGFGLSIPPVSWCMASFPLSCLAWYGLVFSATHSALNPVHPLEQMSSKAACSVMLALRASDSIPLSAVAEIDAFLLLRWETKSFQTVTSTPIGGVIVFKSLVLSSLL